MANDNKKSIYELIIKDIFFAHYKNNIEDFVFSREEIEKSAVKLKIKPPKNLGDVIYSYRYRNRLPSEILKTQPQDKHWLILGDGDAKYRFRLANLAYIEPSKGLLVRKIPNATPELIERYAFNDEQALLAKIRYNRLIDIFLNITTFSLQNHLRTKIPNYGQIEIDELYVGVDARGAQYVIPVQAKSGKDTLGVIQTIQDTMFCKQQERYSKSIVRPVSAQFIGNTIALFELDFDGNDVTIVNEKHYQLVTGSSITDLDLDRYKNGS